MKIFKHKILIITMAMVMSFLACNEERVLFDNENYVAFKASSGSVLEAADAVTADGVVSESVGQFPITIYRSSKDISQEISVSLSQTSQYLTDSDIANAGDDASSTFKITRDISDLVIPAGATSVSFVVLTNDNEDIDGDKRITFSIESVSGGNYTIGTKQSAGKSSSFSLTINDDDFFCPRNSLANAISTEYDVGYATYAVSIDLVGPDGPCLTFDIIGGGSSMWAFNGNSKISGIVLIEDSPGSLTGTINPGNFNLTTLTGGQWNSGGQPINMDILEGGVYNLETGTMEFNYNMKVGATVIYPGTLQYY